MSIKSMSAEELKQKLDGGDTVILVDCREHDEWVSGHIEQAKFIPLSEFQEKYNQLEDKSATIILQCRSGKRSMDAAGFLESQGYADLTNLDGGILDWISLGYPVELGD